ncbi:hydroxylamine oxidation protein HaoB [Candidatus Methylacidiphilum infernorum]|uniref:Hydroxylamine oxidation protein HaoB n=1 Tax=Candidatus Methylacidiphilum infernorum TaxID=511746 RepID=A0ABX7PT49_9BACT|nr:hydroxylamine oxidation protein HaoB [Candidatus Methylacidiphilum infernorum]QSR85949.1 hydroxylamine oxidation protein HaoB [Candidatus Methylacidiphilum infernorum]
MNIEENKHKARWLTPKILLGLALFIGGILLLIQNFFAAKKNIPPRYKVETKEGRFLSLQTFFPVQQYRHYMFAKKGDFWVARYLDQKKLESVARIFPPKPIGSEIDDILYRLWEDVAQVVRTRAPADSLFIAWWDVSQRLKLLTGKEVWIESYDPAVIPKEAHGLLEEVFGSPLETGRLGILAQAFRSPASEGLAILRKALPADRPLLLCVTTDDISNLALALGKAPYELGFEMKIFPLAGADIHGSIPMVMKWVNEKEAAGFLLQQLPTQTILAWRADKKAKETLLGRLLPLTSSLTHPLAGVKLLY